MKRRLFNLLAAVSLVLCAASLLFWAYSYLRRDRFLVRKEYNEIGILADRGCLMVWHTHYDYISNGAYARLEFEYQHNVLQSRHAVLDLIAPLAPLQQVLWWGGFATVFDNRPERTTSQMLTTFPYWLITASLAILPLRWLRRWRRTYRNGFCSVCGYDLRGTPERCPECGTIPVPVQAAGNSAHLAKHSAGA